MRDLLPVWITACAILCGCPTGLPPDVACENVVASGASAQELTAALAAAPMGSCVVPDEGTYPGAFVVPAGVKLVAPLDSSVEVVGDRTDAPALKLESGAVLSGIQVTSAAGIGVYVARGPAEIRDSSISRAATAALLVACLGEGCLGDDHLTLVRNTELLESGYGLWAYGARVRVEGGRSAKHVGFDLASGYGVVASHGALLDMNGTRVEQNPNVGVLVDGAAGTEARLANLTVADNQNRGIWAQGILGSEAAPKLRIDSASITGNKFGGLGAVSSRGIIIVGGRVANTVAAMTMTGDQGLLRLVGDGVGLFGGTGEARVDGVDIAANQRVQVLVDQGARGIIIVGGRVAADAGQLGVVVQRTAEVIESSVEIDQRTSGSEIAVSASTIMTPAP